MIRILRWLLPRAFLVMLSAALVLFACEVGLRVLYWMDARKGGNLQEMLERSRATHIDSAASRFTVRGLVQASSFDDVVYELKPGLEGTFLDQPVIINKHGFRGRDYAREKPEGTYRIVGLGDSVMFGWGVSQDEPYLALLEHELNALEGVRKFEVLNFAVPGYNTTMEVATLEERALAFDPDLVIIHFVANDFGVPLFMHSPDEGLSFKESYLWRFISRRLPSRMNKLDNALVSDRMLDLESEDKRGVLSNYRHMVGRHGYEAAMARLHDLTAARGIPVIVIIGSRNKKHAGHVLRAIEEHGFHLVEIVGYSDAFIARNNIDTTDGAHRKVLWVAPDDSHPSPVAHTIYLEAIMDKLRELGIVQT